MAKVSFTSNSLTPPPFVADWLGPGTLLPGGAKMVTANFTNYTVTVNDDDVAPGDTEITVDALPIAIAAGSILDFGVYTAFTVTINQANIAEGDTSITVEALPGDIPAGTILDFGQHTTGDISMLAKVTADAAAGATTLTVEELAHAIENDAEATFGANRSAFAQVTSAAAKNATSLTVEALAAAIPDDATATYTVTVTNVPAGTLVGRTYAERAAGTDFGPAATSDDEIYLTAWDVTDLTVNNDVELVRHGTLVYEDLIPDWSSLGATMQAAVRAAYQTTRSSGN